jgi:hypothetical protein
MLQDKVLNLRAESTMPVAVILSCAAQKKFTNSSPSIKARLAFPTTAQSFADK